MRDMVTKGRNTKGWKLDERQVKEIRRLREKEGWTMEALAKKFGVGFSQIANVVHHRHWSDRQVKKLAARR